MYRVGRGSTGNTRTPSDGTAAPFLNLALPAAAILLLTWLALRLRGRSSSKARRSSPFLDTVASWPPEAARVLNRHERQALELLRSAVPGRMVLAQVPLSRFLRVPLQNGYTEWLQRVGSLSADLLVCDHDGRVRVVVDIRAAQESARSRQRHDRMGRVLRAAGIHVCVWREGAMPTTTSARSELSELLPVDAAAAATPGSGPMPLIPVPEMAELLADGDSRHFAEFDAAMEPVPSAFFDDMEASPSTARR